MEDGFRNAYLLVKYFHDDPVIQHNKRRIDVRMNGDLIPDEDYKTFIEQRIQISAEVKRTGAFTLIIGNPPYKNNSNLTLSQVAEVFPPLLESSLREARAQERNPRDDYAWFFAAADHYVTGSGVIAFIVSDSFAQHLSYRYFRQDLLRRYHLRQLIRLGPHIFQSARLTAHDTSHQAVLQRSGPSSRRH
jgi:hypothetical protein